MLYLEERHSLGKFDKKCDEGFLLGYSTTSKAYRVCNLDSGTLEEVQDVEFDETKGSQEENENLEDVKGIQLSNAIKNMDVGELRPRQVNDDEDDQVQVISNSNMEDDTNKKCSQNEANLDLVCTPLEISPIVVSNG